MHHTYTLTSESFINPHLVNSSDGWIVTVSEPRRVSFDDLNLQLLDDEPDLPVGSQVKVWMRRFFHCETLEYIEFKRAEQDRKTAAMNAHNETVKQQAFELYESPTSGLIDNNSSAEVLNNHLTALFDDRDREYSNYKTYWQSTDLSLKQQSNDALIIGESITTAIKLLSVHIFERLNKQGIPGNIAYAYSPREGGSHGSFSPGKDHFQLQSSLSKGRLKRVERDVLCKPARKFWGLESHDDGEHSVTCKLCLRVMLSLLDES